MAKSQKFRIVSGEGLSKHNDLEYEFQVSSSNIIFNGRQTQSYEEDDHVSNFIVEEELLLYNPSDEEVDKEKEEAESHKQLKRRKKINRIDNFECLVCDKNYTSEADSKAHWREQHKGMKQYQCKICGIKIRSYPNLTRHFITIHKNYKPYKCGFCGKAFAFKRLRQLHESNEHTDDTGYADPPQECLMCNSFYKDKDELKAHIQAHPESDRYKCKDCGKKMTLLCNLYRHYMTNHSMLENQDNYNSNLDQTYRKEVRQCPMCDKMSEDKKSLNDHCRSHTKYVCKKCKQHFITVVDLLCHFEEMHEDVHPYKCKVCGKTFAFESSLSKHEIDRVKDDLEMECLICNAVASTEEELQLHVKTHAKLKCKVCKFEVKLYHNLKRHYIQFHIASKRHLRCSQDKKRLQNACIICDASFHTEGELIAHRHSIHQGPNIQCKICDVKFESYEDLLQHYTTCHEKSVLNNNEKSKQLENTSDKLMSYVHEEEVATTEKDEVVATEDNVYGFSLGMIGERDPFGNIVEIEEVLYNDEVSKNRFDCLMCDATLFSKSEFETHIEEKHSENDRFKCKVCGKTTPNYTKLKMHFNTIHQRSMPFKCSFCPKSFPYNSIRRVHEKERHINKTLYRSVDHEYRPFKCHICDKTFAYNCSRRFHEWQQHEFSKKQTTNTDKLESPQECLICDVSFNTKVGMQKHIESHSEDALQCKLCEKKVSSYAILLRHNRAMHQKFLHYECRFCKKAFAYICLRKIHEREKHIKTTSDIGTSELKAIKKKRECLMCDKVSRSFGEYLTHMNTHPRSDGFKCKICGRKTTSHMNLKRHYIISHQRFSPFKCNICGQTFPYNCYLRQHDRNEHQQKRTRTASHKFELDPEENGFKCKMCEKQTSTYSHLISHIINVHKAYKPFKCRYCKKSFSYSYTVRQHIKANHGDEESLKDISADKIEYSGDIIKYVNHSKKEMKVVTLKQAVKKYKQKSKPVYSECLMCDKVFSTAYELRCHAKTHSTKDGFKCKVCEMLFSTYTNLGRHSKTIHKNNFPFKCRFCDKSFAYNSVLQRHKKDKHAKENGGSDNEIVMYEIQVFDYDEIKGAVVDTEIQDLTEQKSVALPSNYECIMCEMIFDKKRDLKIHYRSHKSESYKCKQCNKSTTNIQNLERHYRLLHRVCKPKAIECVVCDSSFSTESELCVHWRMHTEFKCKACSIIITSYHNLRRHYTMFHTNQKYNCTTCEISFDNHNDLFLHDCTTGSGEDSVAQTAPPIFECLMCDSIFETKYAQRTHVNSHPQRNCVCKICGKSSSTYNNLTRHFSMLHEKRLPFKCTFCDQYFRFKSYKKAHENRKHQMDLKLRLESEVLFDEEGQPQIQSSDDS